MRCCVGGPIFSIPLRRAPGRLLGSEPPLRGLLCYEIKERGYLILLGQILLLYNYLIPFEKLRSRVWKTWIVIVP